MAPENSLVLEITDKNYLPQVKEYIELTKAKTELQRKEVQKTKTGVFTGAYAINPITNEQMPIYIADYVLNTYATGIVMGVPAHDQRDYDFAKQFGIDIKYVIQTEDHSLAFESDGKHINSPLINGLDNDQASEIIIDYLKKHKLGESHITYKLKD
jgi:leucyl-tRNA synthetase